MRKIYGSKKNGLRELIQNAIDAVLLINDIEQRKTFKTYNPIVGIEFDKSNNKFIVFDNGAGMSEEILKKYFSISEIHIIFQMILKIKCVNTIQLVILELDF